MVKRNLPLNQSQHYFIWLIVPCFVLVLLVGCGGPNVQPVQGTITFHGKPVGPGEILFAPDQAKGTKGKTAMGTFDADGVYTLTSYGEGDGALVGYHKVAIRPRTPGAEPGDEYQMNQRGLPPIAPVYRSFSQTPLTAEVVDGDNKIDFDLK